MAKIVLFAFNGEMTCFVHALLNALDLEAKGHQVQLVVEGTATKLAPLFGQPAGPFAGLFGQVREKGLLAGVCRACAAKMETLAQVEALGLPILDGMSGHAAMEPFIAQGYQVITFG